MRLSRTITGGATLAALLTATVAGGAGAYPAPSRAAHHVALPAGGGKYEQIVAVSAIPHSKDAYAIGTNGLGQDNDRFYLLYEHRGHFKRVWSPKLGGRLGHLDSVYALSKKNVFIGGGIDANDHSGFENTKVEIWHKVGKKIKPANFKPFNFGVGSNGVGAFSGTGPNDVWANGSFYVNNTGGPQALHWNGTKWSVSQLPQSPNFDTFGQISSASRKSVWTTRGDSHLLTYNGSTWIDLGDPFGTGTLLGVTAASPHDVYVSGQDAAGKYKVLRYNGKTSQKTKLKGLPAGSQLAITNSGKNIFAVANFRNKANWNESVILRTTGLVWKKQAMTHGHHLYGLQSISVGSATSGISAGYFYPTYHTNPTPLVGLLKGHHWKIEKTHF